MYGQETLQSIHCKRVFRNPIPSNAADGLRTQVRLFLEAVWYIVETLFFDIS
jgi:hypothetical protein